MKKLYVFDFDGVIADTGEDIAAAVRAAQNHFGVNSITNTAEILGFVGYGAEYLIENTVLCGASLDRQAAVSWYKEYYSKHCVEKSVLYDGVKETLEKLRARGDFVCMFTNKPRAVTERSLKILGIYDLFDNIFCPEDLDERKPAPEGIIRCMEACGVSAKNTLMIGDSAADIVAAKAAGVRSCGVLCGIGDREKMMAEKPDFTVKTVSELMKKEKKNSVKGQARTLMAIQFAGYLACGVAGGYLLGRYDVGNNHAVYVALFAAVIVFFVLAIFLSIITHEAGHMVFGWLSGYELSSFRVGGIILVKNGRKFRLKRFNIPGTGGQCLMKPPVYGEDMPVIAYNLGGCIFNFIITAFAVIIMIIAGPATNVFILSAMFAALNFTLGLSNILPLNAGIANDGYNLRAMKKDPREKYALWLQLYFMSFLTEGGDPARLPESITEIPADIDYTSHLQAAGAPLLRLAYLEAKGQYGEALRQADEMLQKGNLAPIQKLDLEAERMLLTAVTGKDRDTVTALYTKELQNYVAMMRKYSVAVQALLTALSVLWRDEENKSLVPAGVLSWEEQLAEFERVAKRYPYEGEATGYRKMIEKFVK